MENRYQWVNAGTQNNGALLVITLQTPDMAEELSKRLKATNNTKYLLKAGLTARKSIKLALDLPEVSAHLMIEILPSHAYYNSIREGVSGHFSHFAFGFSDHSNLYTLSDHFPIQASNLN